MGILATIFQHRGAVGHSHRGGDHGTGHPHRGGAHGTGSAHGIPGGGGEHHGHGVMSHAGSYDRLTRLVTLGRRDRIYAGLAALTDAAPGEHAVDLGCGTGALTRALATRVGPRGLVTGIDPSEEMVAFASRTATPTIRYAVHPAEALPFRDESIHVVATALAMHHIDADQRPVAVAEAHRVLVPGGRLLVVDLHPPRNRIARHLIDALTGPEMANSDMVALRGLVEGAGFEVVDVGVRSVAFGYVLGRKP